MPSTDESILYEIKELKAWLYGADGHTGDIPEIKKSVENHQKRITRIEIIMLSSGVLGGGIAGIAKLLGG